MYKVHCLNPISPMGLALFNDDYEITEDVEEADVILVRSANMLGMVMPENLKAVARAGAGVNNIPLEELAERGVPVFNTPGANANAVKELVIAGMLLASRDLIGGNNWINDNYEDPEIGAKAEKAKKQFAGTEIAGKTLGVIGLGAIGAKVALAAEALGMDVIGYDPFLTAEDVAAISPSIRYVGSVAELYPEADFITLHVPSTDATKGKMNEAAIDQMKEGVIVLNFARAALVDDEAMVKALDEGKVRAYVTDFATPTIVASDGAIVLPHLGASTEEAEENCAVMAVEEVMTYLATGEKINCVNME